jgi:hypothetical protein
MAVAPLRWQQRRAGVGLFYEKNAAVAHLESRECGRSLGRVLPDWLKRGGRQ